METGSTMNAIPENVFARISADSMAQDIRNDARISGIGESICFGVRQQFLLQSKNVEPANLDSVPQQTFPVLQVTFEG
jgi:hypothetical protein